MARVEQSNLGAVLKNERFTLGLSQTKMAKKLKLSLVWYCELENGKRETTDFTIFKMAKALGYDYVEFLKMIR